MRLGVERFSHLLKQKHIVAPISLGVRLVWLPIRCARILPVDIHGIKATMCHEGHEIADECLAVCWRGDNITEDGLGSGIIVVKGPAANGDAGHEGGVARLQSREVRECGGVSAGHWADLEGPGCVVPKGIWTIRILVGCIFFPCLLFLRDRQP